MSTIVGNYVPSFAEADMGMLLGVSLNAPYPFHWVYLTSVDSEQVICTGADKQLSLRIMKTRAGERAHVTVQDPIFGPQKFEVAPFLRRDHRPVGGALGL